MKHLTTSNLALNKLLGNIYPSIYTIRSTNRGNTATTFVPYFINQILKNTSKENMPDDIYIVYDYLTNLDDINDIFNGMRLSSYLDENKYPNIHLRKYEEFNQYIHALVHNSVIFYIYTSRLVTSINCPTEFGIPPYKTYSMQRLNYDYKDLAPYCNKDNNDNYIFIIQSTELKYVDRFNEVLYQYKNVSANLETQKTKIEYKPSLEREKSKLKREFDSFKDMQFLLQNQPLYFSEYVMESRSIDYDAGYDDEPIDTNGITLLLRKTPNRKLLDKSTIIRFVADFVNIYQSQTIDKHYYTNDTEEAE